MAKKAIKRAFTLYLAHMITTFITLALFICGAWLFHRPGLLVEINILAVLMNLTEGIPALLLLGHQIGYNNILPMYGALMLMVPVILLLYSRTSASGAWCFGCCVAVCGHLSDRAAQHADRRLLVPQSTLVAVLVHDRRRRHHACQAWRQAAGAPGFCSCWLPAT